MTDTLLDPSLGPLTARPIGAGKVFFVSGAGNNNNSGITPNEPFATITNALDECLSDRRDYIYILSETTEPSYPIEVTIGQVHIIGLTVHGTVPGIRINGGGNPCIRLLDDANYSEIAGIGFATGASDGIDSLAPSTVYSPWIHHCSFGGSSLNDGATHLRSGIVGGGRHFPHMTVEDCFFGSGGWTWGRLTGYGIGFSQGIVGGIIQRNSFMNCTLGSIWSNGANIEIGRIFDNWFYFDIASGVAPKGWAIYLQGAAATYGGHIVGNHATQTGDNTKTDDPYQDTSTGALATLRGWGLNYLNDVPTDPV